MKWKGKQFKSENALLFKLKKVFRQYEIIKIYKKRNYIVQVFRNKTIKNLLLQNFA